MSYCYLPTVPRLTLTSLFSLPYSQFLSYLLSCILEWSCQIYRFCFWLMENVLPLQYQDLNGWVGYRFEIFAWGKIRKFSPVEHNYNQTLIIIVFTVKQRVLVRILFMELSISNSKDSLWNIQQEEVYQLNELMGPLSFSPTL